MPETRSRPQAAEPAAELSPPARWRDVLHTYRLPLSMVAFNVTGAVSLVVLVGWHGVSAVDLAIFATTYLLGMIGLEVGMHRCFSHRAFAPSRGLRNALVVLGAMGGQGSALVWATNHRKHHRFADRDGDPHSPRPQGTGGRGSLRGLWHGHFAWHFREAAGLGLGDFHRYSRDLATDRELMWIDRHFWRWVALGLLMPGGVGLVWSGTADGAITAFLWGGPIRIFFVDNVVWLVNSVAHAYGARPWESRDRSTNVPWLVLPSLGAGWHNAHHAFPASARTALEPGQADPGYWLIRAFEVAGLATDVQVATPREQPRSADA